MAKVAFLGLGVMGYPMARHLKAKGHDVTVYNRTTPKAEKWVAENGGGMGATPRPAGTAGRWGPRRGGRAGGRTASAPAWATPAICARSRSDPMEPPRASEPALC